jgi:hypothetical protein
MIIHHVRTHHKGFPVVAGLLEKQGGQCTKMEQERQRDLLTPKRLLGYALTTQTACIDVFSNAIQRFEDSKGFEVMQLRGFVIGALVATYKHITHMCKAPVGTVKPKGREFCGLKADAQNMIIRMLDIVQSEAWTLNASKQIPKYTTKQILNALQCLLNHTGFLFDPSCPDWIIPKPVASINDEASVLLESQGNDSPPPPLPPNACEKRPTRRKRKGAC